MKVHIDLVGILFLFQITMKVGILAPINETCRSLAAKLLESGMQVAFLCPSKLDDDLAETMISELAVLGKEQDNLHIRQESFSVVKLDLTDCDVLGGFVEMVKEGSNEKILFYISAVPFIDVKNTNDSDYSDMCFNLFSLFKSLGVSFFPEAKVVFGQNVA